MSEKQSYRLQTLLVILIINAVMLAAIGWFSGAALQNQWRPMAGIGLVASLVLWFVVQSLGVRLAERAARSAVAAPPRSSREERPRPTPPVVAPAAPVAEPTPSAESGAVQILSILQRQGRLIDFLQEDLSLYADEQIGAAVRSIHESTHKALTETIKLTPIYAEAEGSTVTVQPGFDTRQVRLTGNVVGNPPFKGELRHRGWRVAQIDLPQQMPGADKTLVIAPAEVEVSA